MKELNVLIVGVGGQGTLLASTILGNIALEQGYDVKLSEVHGMAQRGGSVVTHVRMSDGKVNAPIIDKGGSDVIVAFELLEGMRWLPYLKKGGKLFINDSRINPMPVIIGTAKYPENIIDYISENDIDVTVINALEIAESCGSSKAVNTVLLGALSKELGYGEEICLEQIEKTVKPKFIELNKEAFLKGRVCYK
ncbi:MAG: indolepyruvate oxidoreductase subunit beta [Anaerovoracaceae bacterium]